MNEFRRPRIRTAPGVAATSLGQALMQVGGRVREDRLANEAAARDSALRRSSLLVQYADRPEYSFEDASSPSVNPNTAVSAGLRASTQTAATGAPGVGIGARLAGIAAGQMPDLPDPRRHVTDIDFGDGSPLRVMFDSSKTPEAIKARSDAEKRQATVEANRAAFARLRALDPDSFIESDYSDDVDWSKFVPDALKARGHERTMFGTGHFDAPSAHLEAFHNYNLPAEQRARASNAREQGRFADWQIDRALEGLGGQARQLIAEGISSDLVFDELRKMPAARGIPEGRLRQAVFGAQDANAVAENRERSGTRQQTDRALEERRRGVVDMIGRTPIDELEQIVVDELAKGTNVAEVNRLIETSVQLNDEEKRRARSMLDRYSRRLDMRAY